MSDTQEDYAKSIYDHLLKWSPRGQIGQPEAKLLARFIEEQKSESIVEVGVASGFSSAFMAHCMKRHTKNGVIAAIDYGERLYYDTSKDVCFIALEEAKDMPEVKIESHTSRTSADIEQIAAGRKFDAALIDGDHYQPWCALDSLMLLPFLKPGGFVFCHDLHLYLVQNYREQYGPKVVYDQLPEDSRFMDDKQPWPASFVYLVPDDYTSLARNLALALMFPWPEGYKRLMAENEKIIPFLDKYWPKAVRESFEASLL